MKSHITTILAVIICAYSIICAGAAETSAYEIGSCQNLTTENGNYILNQTVSSAGTCFNILADNITLDGNSHTINYSQTSTGYAVNNSAGFNNITIRNCNIVQGSTNSDSIAITYYNSNNGLIENNTITTSGYFCHGIETYITNNNIISKNTIKTDGSRSSGIHILSSDNDRISDNTVAAYGEYSDATGISSLSNNIMSDNTFTAHGNHSYGAYLRHLSNSTISNNTFATYGKVSTGASLKYLSDSTISDNTFTTHGHSSCGASLNLFGNSIISENNLISNNAFTTHGNISAGAILDSLGSSTILGNTFTTYGDYFGSAILKSLSNSTISDNTITVYGDRSGGVSLDSSSNNTISDNTITTFGNESGGISIHSSYNNKISGGSISSKQSSDYYLENASNTNTFIDTNFTASRQIYLDDDTSWFNYNNETNGSIWLNTTISSQSTITRTLTNWNRTLLQWNDTNSSTGISATYRISGLIPDAIYLLYNKSIGTEQEQYYAHYSLKADSDGTLPEFTLFLNGETEITLVAYAIPAYKSKPPHITIDYPKDKSIIPSDTTYFNITTDENATCTYSYSGYDVPVPPYTSHYLCGLNGCVGQSIPGTTCGCRSSYKIMDITGTTKHSQNVRIHWTLLRYENILIANCTDSEGNSNTSSISVISRKKPLTIDTLKPDDNIFTQNKTITIYVRLTTNYTIDQLRLNIKRPDNTTETYDEDDFSEKVGAKQFMKLINMTYTNLTLTGNYTLQLYVNDTQRNIDTATKTFIVHPAVNHIINNSKNSDRVNIYYQNPGRAGTYESLANLTIYPGGYSNITLPGTELDLYFYYGDYYEFNVIIPALDLSEFQKLTVEGKNINKSNISLHSRYTAKDAYVFSIKNSSSMNKSFKVEFDYSDSSISDPKKIVIFKAPYNSTTNETDYDSAIYYSVGNPDYPLYYNSTTEKAWIFVNSFSIFALLEDKATTEICGDGIDNDYDGFIDEGCNTGSSSSSSGGGSPPPVIHECENNTECSINQICENYKCTNITCSYCEYIENHECKRYECCEDKDCKDSYLCKNHQCIKQEDKEDTIIDNTADTALQTIDEINETEIKDKQPAKSESINILGYTIKNPPSKTTITAIIIWLTLIVLVFLKKDKIRNIILNRKS